MIATKLGVNDTIPIVAGSRQHGYDFARRPDGWQMVILKPNVKWSDAMAHARQHGLNLDHQGYLLK